MAGGNGETWKRAWVEGIGTKRDERIESHHSPMMALLDICDKPS
jgi:hypothetical protein